MTWESYKINKKLKWLGVTPILDNMSEQLLDIEQKLVGKGSSQWDHQLITKWVNILKKRILETEKSLNAQSNLPYQRGHIQPPHRTQTLVQECDIPYLSKREKHTNFASYLKEYLSAFSAYWTLSSIKDGRNRKIVYRSPSTQKAIMINKKTSQQNREPSCTQR